MIQRRIEREKQTISAMMIRYCHDHHGETDGLCESCAQLLDYAHKRLDTCPFQEHKPACNQCTVHCYSRIRRDRIQAVMRYSGPKMLFRHPLLSLYHLIDKFRKAPKLGGAEGS
ncbi:MAG: nitrous oxide-stimulated promoter family protein [Candidatus Thiodiazotropha sp.]